jgi:DNA-binding PadR family transcriptional regulator
MPQVITQTGIAKAIDVEREKVATVLKRLENRGLVKKETRHVRDSRRTRNVYFLTSRGEERAKETDEGR